MTRVIAFFIFIAAAGFLYGAIHFYLESRHFLATAVLTEGVVIDIETRETTDSKGSHLHQTPWLQFVTKDGQEIHFRSHIETNSEVGTWLNVLYDPKHPQNARIAGFAPLWMPALIFLAGAGISFCVGWGFYAAARTEERRRWLQQNGQRIEAKIVAVEPWEAEKVRNQSEDGRFRTSNTTTYWIIRAQWLDSSTGKVGVFESEPLPFDPKEYLKDTVPVLISPQNPRDYCMDLSFLPEVE